MRNELSGLSARELEILGILGFDFGGQKTAKKFVKKAIASNTKMQLHDKGIPLRYLMRIATKLNVSSPLQPSSRRTSKEEIDEELRGMISQISI